MFNSAEKPSVHPSRASQPVLSLTKERTEEAVEIIGDFPFMLSLVKSIHRVFQQNHVCREELET
jgi:hypothetical protein